MRRDSPSTKPKAGKSHPCHSFAGPAPDKGGPSKQPWVWRSPGPPKHRPSQAPLLLLTLNPVSRIREFPHSNESSVWGSASHESPFLAENKPLPRHCQAASAGHCHPALQGALLSSGRPSRGAQSRGTGHFSCNHVPYVCSFSRIFQDRQIWQKTDCMAPPGHTGHRGVTASWHRRGTVPALTPRSFRPRLPTLPPGQRCGLREDVKARACTCGDPAPAARGPHPFHV